MFARGFLDEGIKRLHRKSPMLSSCDQWAEPGVAALDRECLRSNCTQLTTPLPSVDYLAEVNNMACSLYESGSINESLEKLRLLVQTVQSEVRLSTDDATQRSLATILRNIAHIYFVKELYLDALSFSKQAVNFNIDDGDEFSASLWFNLGLLTWQVEKTRGQAESALRRSLEILTTLRTECVPPAPTIVDRDIVSVHALLLLIQEQHQGRVPVNNVSLLRMLMAKRTSFGYEHASVSNTLCTLASLYMKQRKYEVAATFFREALRLQRKLNLSVTMVFRTLTLLGQCLQPLGRNIEAMSCFRDALRLKGKTIMREGAHVQAMFATALYNIGMIQSCQGNRNDQQRRMRALHSFKLCLDLRRRALGSHNPAVASALHNIGILLLEDDQVTKSLECFQESLHIRRKAFGSRDHEVASSLRHIGKIIHDRGEYHESLRLYLEALWILRKSSGDSPEHLIEVLMGLGEAQHSNGLFDQALKS